MNLKKYSWLAILPMIFSACQDDMLENKQLQQKVYTLSANMSMGDADSRAQIVLGGTNKQKEIFHWNEGDEFTAYQLEVTDGKTGITYDATSHLFAISSSYSNASPNASADFSTSQGMDVGRPYVAFYPTPTQDEDGLHLNINNTLPNNSADSWREYFKENMYMRANANVSNPMDVRFEHLGGIIRITYRNTSSKDVRVKKLEVDGDWTFAYRYQLGSKCDLVGASGMSGAYGLTFMNAATVPAGGTCDFYILYLQNLDVNENTKRLTQVSVTRENNIRVSTDKYSGIIPVFEAGKCYWLNITDDGDEIHWTKYHEEDGGNGNGGEVQDRVVRDVYTEAELKDALTLNANDIIVIMQNDIQLTSPLTIAHKALLDLGGHTLSVTNDFNPGDGNAVFNVVSNQLRVLNGSLQGGNTSKPVEYYFSAREKTTLNLCGVSLNTGTGIANAIYSMDANVVAESLEYEDQNGNKSVLKTQITTGGTAIRYDAGKEIVGTSSRFNADINGNVYIFSNNRFMYAYFIFGSGNINGNLMWKVDPNISAANYVKYSHENVVIGDAYKSTWSEAGRYAPDKNIEVETFAQLKAAVEEPQIADEYVHITLKNDILLEAPLKIRRYVRIFGSGHKLTVSENFAWDNTKTVMLVEGGKSLLGLVNLGVHGCDASMEGTNMVLCSGETMYLSNSYLKGNGIPNGVYISNSIFNVSGSSDIQVTGNALDLNASTKKTYASIQTSGTIAGKIVFKARGDVESFINVMSGTINGDLRISGDFASQVKVTVASDATINGNGWPTVNSASGETD